MPLWYTASKESRILRLLTSNGGKSVPSRRILELTVVAIVAMRPVFGLVHLWARKTLDGSTPGSVSHGVAEILTVVV